MPDWLQNPHADYVMAAYGVAVAALVGLLVASMCKARRAHKAWQKLQK
jgi:heme exporter protein CcmD